MAQEYFNLDKAIEETVAGFTPADCFLNVKKYAGASGLTTSKSFEGDDAAVVLFVDREELASGRLEWCGVWIVPADKKNGVADQFGASGRVPVEGLIAFASRPKGPEKLDPFAAFNRLFPAEARRLESGRLVAMKVGKESWTYTRATADECAEYSRKRIVIGTPEARFEMLIVPANEGDRLRGLIEDGQLERARELTIYQYNERDAILAMYQTEGGEQ